METSGATSRRALVAGVVTIVIIVAAWATSSAYGTALVHGPLVASVDASFPVAVQLLFRPVALYLALAAALAAGLLSVALVHRPLLSKLALGVAMVVATATGGLALGGRAGVLTIVADVVGQPCSACSCETALGQPTLSERDICLCADDGRPVALWSSLDHQLRLLEPGGR